jgi:hypothetical protein
MDEHVLPSVDVENIEFISGYEAGPRTDIITAEIYALGRQGIKYPCEKLMLPGSDIGGSVKHADVIGKIMLVSGKIGKAAGRNTEFLRIRVRLRKHFNWKDCDQSCG